MAIIRCLGLLFCILFGFRYSIQLHVQRLGQWVPKASGVYGLSGVQDSKASACVGLTASELTFHFGLCKTISRGFRRDPLWGPFQLIGSNYLVI